ncbi:putative pp-loop atpase superfamily protein [Neofusicoccum parvum UCRNP2]|uniref:Putative pp-loop atpase superfamily protein n=1 Tax=Botryosphaeria parva (strain UCR-NP2) TaxID=1287680 RepID=R1EGT5_BOTPV|nr:putative pp-loop atpase superfamily protein [Neofusicoccum parvum UCRNP2]
MPPSLCALCQRNRALILRPKDHQKLCKLCFLDVFETEIHHTITSTNLFQRGEKIAIGASGGKDSTVLASVLKTLNERYDYGVELILLSIDEGIKGYRDDSLETVKRNAVQYDMPLTIVGYDELYGWTMDQVVEQVGKKGNCTYCGVFRRQALDRGAARLGVQHVVTGHNADDVAETVLMNLLRGDLPRLSRTTSIVTSTPSAAPPPSGPDGTIIIDHTNIKRSKPLKYAYEKEIVLYAHHKNLDYFSTENQANGISINNQTSKKTSKQAMGKCAKCGYISSQTVCKACTLLEGLNKSRPKTAIGINGVEAEEEKSLKDAMKGVSIAAE